MISLKSYAKCNLLLSIDRKLPNGYHEIRTIMSYLDLHDEINIIKTNNSLKVDYMVEIGGKINLTKEDLITKCFRVLKNECKIDDNFHIIVDKKIPILSGLGGGSSNAGVIINFCNEYFDLNLSQEEMCNFASKIGADVAFFTQNSTALCSGIGDKIEKINNIINFDKYHILYFDLHEKCSTGNIYEAFDALSNKNIVCKNDSAIDKILRMNEGSLPIDIVRETEGCINFLTDLDDFAIKKTKKILSIARENDIDCRITGAGSGCLLISQSKELLNNFAKTQDIDFKNINLIDKIEWWRK